MPKKRPTYSVDFIVSLLKQLDEGRTVRELAAVYKVNSVTIYTWLRQAKEGKFKGYRPKFVIKTARRHSRAFKLAAVKRIEKGETFAEVSRDLNVYYNQLSRWYTQFSTTDQPRTKKIGTAQAERAAARLRAQDQEAENQKQKLQQAIRTKADRAKEMTADPLIWMQEHTQTKDSHWRERGAKTPYRPFPDKPYFRPAIEDWQREPVVFIEKSRNMMLSWLCVGFFTHAAMTTPGIEILFQSQKEEKAFELVDYAKVLYDHQPEELQEAFPLVKKLKDMADGELMFANGSRIIGIPGGADQIRSYHPWGLLMDEAAFMPEAGDSYNNAVSVCQKIIMVSSAGPGWFADVCNSGTAISN